MRKVILSVSAVLVCLAGASTAYACGDKLLALGRGVRFQRANVAAHPASLLLYVGQGSNTSLANAQLQSTLKQAGHKLETVSDSAKLDQGLKSGKFDLVLVGYSDVGTLAEHMKAASANALIVPVIGKANKADYAAASKQFTFVVKSGDPSDYLVTIDQALKSRTLARN